MLHHALIQQNIAVDTRLTGGDNRDLNRSTRAERETLQLDGRAAAILAQHGAEFPHHGGHGGNVNHHPHGKGGMVDKAAQRQYTQHGTQRHRRRGARLPHQAPDVGGGREVGVGQYDLVAMAQ